MSDAPERIWARFTEDFGAVQIGQWADSIRIEPRGTEYIRADIAEAKDARIADLERQLAEAREVKPLEWRLNAGASGPYYSAYCPVFVTLHHAADEVECDTIDTAWAARILSALKEPKP